MSALPQHRPGRQRAPRAARGGCSFTQPTAAGPAEMAVSIIFKGILDTGGSDRACRGLSVRDARATRRWQDSQYGKRYGPDNLLHASPRLSAGEPYAPYRIGRGMLWIEALIASLR
jgi:hypothetical protein